MHRNEKEALVEEVTALLAGADALYVSDYRGLTVAELTELRGKLRAGGARLRVLKNTLTRMAAERAGRARARAAVERPHGHHHLRRRTPWRRPRCSTTSPARTTSSRSAAACSKAACWMPPACAPSPSLPPREVLVARVVGTMAAPLSGLVTVLQGSISGLARALQQIADQKAAA